MRHDESRSIEGQADPLTEAVLLILLSLAAEPRHGYSILKDLAEISSGRVVMSTGTLYGALRRLLDQKWIERFEEADAVRGRIAYRLAPDGQRRLGAEVQRMNHLTHLARLRTVGMEA